MALDDGVKPRREQALGVFVFRKFVVAEHAASQNGVVSERFSYMTRHFPPRELRHASQLSCFSVGVLFPTHVVGPQQPDRGLASPDSRSLVAIHLPGRQLAGDFRNMAFEVQVRDLLGHGRKIGVCRRQRKFKRIFRKGLCQTGGLAKRGVQEASRQPNDGEAPHEIASAEHGQAEVGR